MKIVTIPINFSLDEIHHGLKDKKATYLNHNILYYPYWVLEANVAAKVLTRSFIDHLCCWIDLVNGREALSEPTFKTEEKEVEEKHLIKKQVKTKDIERKAKSYINFALLNKVKLIKTPKIHIINQNLIYRPYYVVRYIENEVVNSMMIDGINGEHYALSL